MSRQQINRLKEERAGLFEEQKALVDKAESEERDLTEEEAQEYDRREADIDSLSKRAKRLEDLEGIEPEDRQRRQVPPEGENLTDEERAERERELNPGAEEEQRVVPQTLKEWKEQRAAKAGKRPQDEDEYREAFYRLVTVSDMSELEGSELRVLSKATAGAGGNLVPTSFYNTLIDILREFGVVRQLAGRIETDSGEQILIPKVSSKGTAAWIAENAAYSESDDAFGQTALNAYKAGTLIKVSEELLTDSAFDLEAYIRIEFGARIGVLENTAYVVGDGSGKPTGFQPNVTVGKAGAAGQVTSIIADDIIDLIHSISSPYRQNLSILMHDKSVAKVRKLKSNDNQYLWQPGMTAGQPDVIFGIPVYTDPDMPEMGASVKSIVAGDFRSGYLIRDVNGIFFQRLLELFAGNGQVGFRAYHRTDGKIVNDNALRAYQNPAA